MRFGQYSTERCTVADPELCWCSAERQPNGVRQLCGGSQSAHRRAVRIQYGRLCEAHGTGSNVSFALNTLILIKILYFKIVLFSPDTASFVQKVEREREARDRGEVKDNRGFLAKYWMYIVPVVILVFLTSAAGPDGAQGAAR